MIGRKVDTGYCGRGKIGEVVAWEPLVHGMCDAKVQHADGSVCWYGSESLRPIDGRGPLSSRADAREAARVKALASLKEIRAQHVRDFHKPWPGAEHGKAIIGNAINGAIAKLERKG